MRLFFRRLLQSNAGLAFIEFALVAPFLLLLLFGGLELSRFMLIAQKVDKAAYIMGDLTSRYPAATADRKPDEINVAKMNDTVFQQLAGVLKPYNTDNASVIVTSIYKEGDTPVVKWQIARTGYQDGETRSVVNGQSPSGVNGAGAGLKNSPANFSGDAEIAEQMAGMLDGENMIVAEVFYRYQPIVDQVLGGLSLPFTLGSTTLKRRVFVRGRVADLICLPETFVYPNCERGPTTPPPTGGFRECRDRCGEVRTHGELWCDTASSHGGGITRTFECRDSTIIDRGGISGLGCDAAGGPIVCN